jgi:predicted PurR-regulated permease PerM
MTRTKAAPRPASSGEEETHALSRDRVLVFVLIAVTAAAICLCLVLLLPFLPALTWALALAVIGRPLHEWLGTRVRWPNLAALLSVVIVSLIILLPAIFLVHHLVSQATEGIEQLRAAAKDNTLRDALANHPRLAQALQWAAANIDLPGELDRALRHFAGDLLRMVRGSVWAILLLLITLLTLFFFFRDRRAALQTVRSLMPLAPSETKRLFNRVDDMVHAVLYGTLLVALVQGSLAGLMFWWLGLPSPILWAFVMSIAAVVPWLGTFVVWLPAAALLAVQGEWIKAIFLTGWGLAVVGTIDNLLYPVFVGNRIRLHTLAVFFAIVGGLFLFGGSGVILGPLILAITIALIDIWRRRAADENTLEKDLSGA